MTRLWHRLRWGHWPEWQTVHLGYEGSIRPCLVCQPTYRRWLEPWSDNR